jgi:hypothetical protein
VGATAVRLAVLAAWLSGLVALASWSETTAALWCAGAATVIAGLLVGRWWALLVPGGIALVLALGVIASGEDPGERWEAAPERYAVGVLAAGAVAAALLALGIAVHKLTGVRRPGRRA